ncbi:MAG: GNAT family N-acetyltransferase [Flavisolibacter sp.]
MTVQHKNSDTKGLFYVELEEEMAAEMVYTIPKDNIMMIEHTEVSEPLQGKNIGYELVHAAVEYARHHGLKIIATCSFASKVLSKKPEWQDVVEREM